MPKYAIRKTSAIVFLLSLFLFLSACQSDFVIEDFPQNKSYVGIEGDDLPLGVTSSLPKLPAIIAITYPASSKTPPVFINGQKVSEHLSYQLGEAHLDMLKIKALLRQGENTIQVDPNSFGPKISFTFDNSGPELVLDEVKNVGTPEQAAYVITLFAKDTVAVKNLSIERMDYSFDGGLENGLKVEKISATGEITAFVHNQQQQWQSASAVNAASLYKITAEDAHGFTTEDYYLAPNQKLNNIFKLKLDSHLLAEASPLLKEQIKDIAIYAPKEMAARGQTPAENAEPSDFMDKLSAWWTSGGIFYSSNGAAIKVDREYNAAAFYWEPGNQNYCGYADIETKDMNLTNNDFVCTNVKREIKGLGLGNTDNYYCSLQDLEYRPAPGKIKPGYCSRIYMTEARVKNADSMSVSLDQNRENRLRLETKVNDINIRMGIRNIRCGFKESDFRSRYVFPDTYRDRGVKVNKDTGIPTQSLDYVGESRGGFCRDEGGVSYVISLGDMNITADSSDVKGDIDIAIKDGQVSLGVVKGLKLGLGNVKVGNDAIDWILPILSGILNDLFVSIVEDTLKQNLANFILGFDLFTDQDVQAAEGDIEQAEASMRLQAQAYQVWSAKDDNNTMQWYMNYAGYLNNIKPNKDVSAILGSYYVPERLDSPTSLIGEVDLSLNTNLINQALATMYLSGVTHINVLSKVVEGKQVFFGPSVADDLSVSNGTLRVELVPETPGIFEMQQDDATGTQAQIYYRNAQMNIDSYKDGQWQREIDLQVDMRLGVLMQAKDGKFELTILGTPELTLHVIRFQGKDYFYTEGDNGFLGVAGNVMKAIVQKGVDLLLNIATPQLAQNLLRWDWPAMPIEGTGKEIHIKTQELKANNNRHLQFALEISVQDAP